MSDAMNQKAEKKRKKKKANKANKSKRSGLPVVEEEVIEEELTFGDKLLANITPYMGTIVFALLAGFVAFALIAFMLRSSADSKAFEWRELNSASSIARQTGNISQWKRVAEEYPDSKAGLWASQFAGDYQLREGLSKLASDQKTGFGLIKKSKPYFQSVIDAPASAKTPMLQQRSHFSLAYACESLGEFKESQALYEKLIEEAPESAFVEHARRGLTRASSDDYGNLYAKFTNWEEEMIGEAPGPNIPERPSIDFPKVDLPPGEKPPTTSLVPGGDFESSATKMAVEKKPADAAAQTSTAVAETVEKVVAEPVEKVAVPVETKPAEAAVVETVEKVAAPAVGEATEVVKEAASATKPAVNAVTEKLKKAVEATK